MCMSHYYVSRMLHHHVRKWKFALIRETTDENCSRVQVELTGNSIYEYIYPDDRNEMVSVLNLPQNPTDLAGFTFPPPNSRGEIELERAFLLRMKCILAKRNAGLVTEGYKVNENLKIYIIFWMIFGARQKIYGSVLRFAIATFLIWYDEMADFRLFVNLSLLIKKLFTIFSTGKIKKKVLKKILDNLQSHVTPSVVRSKKHCRIDFVSTCYTHSINQTYTIRRANMKNHKSTLISIYE